METLKQIFMGFVMIAGLSLAVTAQRNGDQKKPPPKERPPKVEPAPEKPPPREPRGGDKPKKPGGYSILFINKDDFLA